MLYLIKGLNKNYTDDYTLKNYIYNNFQCSFCSYAFTNRKCVKTKNDLVQVVRVLAPLCRWWVVWLMRMEKILLEFENSLCVSQRFSDRDLSNL
jgi:hypothetical protein